MVENKRELKVGDKIWAFRNQGPDGKYTIIRSDIIEDIYEGDIIRSFDSNGNAIYHHIEYRGASFVAILKIDHFPVDRIESTLTQDWLNEFDKVIIGNIHDDKDYLIK